MMGKTKVLEARLRRRQCVACGYDGAMLRGGAAARCARCGCDLRRRPARSYMEMEGFRDITLPRQPWPKDDPVEARMLARWIAFLFVAMMGMVTLIYLSAAAFSM